MKNSIKLFLCIVSFIFALGLTTSCTDSFTDINTDPELITKEDASARYFFTTTQVNLFAPYRFYYWRSYILTADRYAGYFAIDHNEGSWNGSLMYKYHSAYSNATWGFFSGNFSPISTFLRLTEKGGDFENPKMHAVGLIMKSLLFQMWTDTYGMLPYSEAGKADIKLPDFDTQKAIYKGIIADLNQAMKTIGNAKRTGTGIEDLGKNDIFFNGNLQKWKRFANTLKLRLAIRALGAPGANFARKAVKEALNAPLLRAGENALLKQDNEISTWSAASYGDIWFGFPGKAYTWKASNYVVETLKDSNDPRLKKYAQPAPGGKVTISRPSSASKSIWQKRVNFILDGLDKAGVDYNANVTNSSATIKMAEDTYYVGAPMRLRPEMSHYVAYDLYSAPNQYIIQEKDKGKPIAPEVVLSAAESFFLQATAAVKGFSGNAQALYKKGIREAMKLWDVESAAIDKYLANSPMAKLTGSKEDKLRKIATQRWLASYTASFEGWSIVRKTGYPKEIANGVLGEDSEIYSFSGVNGKFPTRLRYGSELYDSNSKNLQEALQKQGPDRQTTKLWWQK